MVLFDVLETCLQEKIVDYVVADPRESMCILGWQTLRVHDVPEFRRRLLSMVKDHANVWNKNHIQLKNPGWGVYELLRGIGVRPKLRGPVESDPGKFEMLYYEAWQFSNDDSFKTARQRLARGFQFNPERGDRPRKRRAREMMPIAS